MTLNSIVAVVIAFACLGVLIGCAIVNIVDIYKEYKRVRKFPNLENDKESEVNVPT